MNITAAQLIVDNGQAVLAGQWPRLFSAVHLLSHFLIFFVFQKYPY